MLVLLLVAPLLISCTTPATPQAPFVLSRFVPIEGFAVLLRGGLVAGQRLDSRGCLGVQGRQERTRGAGPIRAPHLASNQKSPCGMGGAAGPFSSGRSVTSASVVSISEAMEAAFSSATRSTLVGSMTPACSMSTYS